jgi:CRP-like cAMP-binding protein
MKSQPAANTPPQVSDLLKRHPLLSAMTAAECDRLVDKSVVRTVRRGEILFRAGDQCSGLHLLIEGKVRSYRSNASGDEQVMNVLEPGDLLGEVAVFDEGPYVTSARALETSRVLYISFDAVHELYASNVEVARAVLKELGRRVRTLTSLVDELGLGNVLTRVASALIRFADAAGNQGPNGVFQMPRTQEELAAELGTTREGVARALRSLRREGIIQQSGRRVEITDRKKLADIARSRSRTIRYHHGGAEGHRGQ